MMEMINQLDTKFSILNCISIDDSQSIIQIRTRKIDSYLKPISHSVIDQNKYYYEYKKRYDNHEEIYFKITDKKNPNLISGLVRITDLNKRDAFSWESLIIADGAPAYMAIDAMMTIYRLGFEYFGKTSCGPWVIPVKGKSMLRLHNKIGMAEEVGRDNINYYMTVRKKAFDNRYEFFKKLGFGMYTIN